MLALSVPLRIVKEAEGFDVHIVAVGGGDDENEADEGVS